MLTEDRPSPSTHPAPVAQTQTATIAPTGVPYVYEGVPIYARGFATAAVYDSPWVPPANSAWVEYGYISNCWRHSGYPHHILWKPEDDLVVTAQLASAKPDATKVLELGRLALGPAAAPLYVASYPLALRLPMRGPGQLVVPTCRFRCRRLWPGLGEPAHLEEVGGVPIELRITGSSGKQGVQLYAEAFVGRAHQNRNQKPRSLVFSGDARHVRLDHDLQRVKRFTARLSDRLLGFACSREDQGLEVDDRALSGLVIGRVHISKDIADVEFDIRLPQPGGTVSYVGNFALP